MQPDANVHMLQFLLVQKGKYFYRQICLDTGQFYSISNCSHSTFESVTEGLQGTQYKLTVGKQNGQSNLKFMSSKYTQYSKRGRIFCSAIKHFELSANSHLLYPGITNPYTANVENRVSS